MRISIGIAMTREMFIAGNNAALIEPLPKSLDPV